MRSSPGPVEDAVEYLPRDNWSEAGDVDAAAVTYRSLCPTPRLDTRRAVLPAMLMRSMFSQSRRWI
jgi:hypothetical protein